MYVRSIAALISVPFVLLAVTVFAEEATGAAMDTATNAEANTLYGYGSVVEVKKDSNEIVVNEYDWDKEAETAVTYSIDPQAKVENAESWAQIPQGSYVDIEYVMGEGGKKIAKYLSVYLPEPVSVE